MSANIEAAAPPRNPFPFQHKTNTLDRDRIVVPAGWDSWGKIAVLREGFDAKSWGEAWERDVDVDATDIVGTQGAKALYSSLVPDQGTKVYLRISQAQKTIPTKMPSVPSSSLHYHRLTTQPLNKFSSPNTTTRKRRGLTLRMILVEPSIIRWRMPPPGSWAQ